MLQKLSRGEVQKQVGTLITVIFVILPYSEITKFGVWNFSFIFQLDEYKSKCKDDAEKLVTEAFPLKVLNLNSMLEVNLYKCTHDY